MPSCQVVGSDVPVVGVEDMSRSVLLLAVSETELSLDISSGKDRWRHVLAVVVIKAACPKQ